MLMAMLDRPSVDDPLCGEKLSPILSVWRFREFEQAVTLVCALTQISGRGHSCGIHTRKPERIETLARAAGVSRVMVNQSTGMGNSGDYSNGLAFTAVLCCGTWGTAITNENITWHHLLNYTWVSEPIPARVPQEEALFAAHWARFGT